MKALILLLFFVLATYAKPYSVSIDGPFEDVLFDITEDYNRDISAVGFSQHYRQDISSGRTFNSAFDYLQSVESNSGEQLRLIRLNSDTKVTLDFTNRLSRFNRAVSVIKNRDNGYYIGGYTQDGELLLLKVSSSGSLQLIRQFGTKNYDRMNKLIALRDGGVLAVGSSMTSRSRRDPMYTQGIGLNDIYITRFDYNGNISWSKKYGTRSDDRGIDAAEAFDGTLLILANSSENKTQDITLMRLSEEGDKIWLRRYKSKGVLNAHRLITLRDNHFLTSISYYDKKQQEQTRLLKFDLQKNLLQEHNITTDGSNIISDIKERSNGAIVGVGHHTTKLKTEAMAITLDNHLRPIWERFFNNYERSKFNALTLLHDGKIAIAGELTDRGSEITNMWIIKLNRDGSTAQISLKSDTLYAKLLEIFADEIKTKQLSIDESLTIKLISPNLNFKVGEYRLDTQQSKFLQTFNNKLIDLLYSYKDDIKTLHVNGHTSSEWGGLGVDKGYLKNMNLSSKRALSVAQFLYTKQKSEDKKEFLRDILSSDAHSYAQRVIDKTENKKASRRVDFKIELK